MSTDSAYFVPLRSFETGSFKRKVIESLKEMFLIDGYYNEEDEEYAGTELLPFEYASVHDTDQHKMVPEAMPEINGSECHNCHKVVDDAFYDVINDYYDLEDETGVEKDMRGLTLVCPHCKTKQTLAQVVLHQPEDRPVVFANQFFQFADIKEPINQKFVDILKEKLDCDLRLIYEKM